MGGALEWRLMPYAFCNISVDFLVFLLLPTSKEARPASMADAFGGLKNFLVLAIAELAVVGRTSCILGR